MSKFTTVAAFVILTAVGVERSLELPKAKVTLRALDEQGNPVQGAQARMSFDKAIPRSGEGGKVPVQA